MRTAICTINDGTYTAADFEQDEHFNYIRNYMVCPQCKESAFFRGVTENGREACFGARHAVGCNMASVEHDGPSDDHQNARNDMVTTGQRIVVDFTYGSAANDTGTLPDADYLRGRNVSGAEDREHISWRLKPLLRTLIESNEFRNSTGVIEVPGHGEYTISDFFVNFADITDEHIGCYRGYWGLIPDARVTENTMWLNSGGPLAPCANIDKKFIEPIYQRFQFEDPSEISGGYILVFGELKKGKNSDKKFVLISDPDYFTICLPENKSVLRSVVKMTTDPVSDVEIKPNNTLCESDNMSLSILISEITDLNSVLSQYICQHVTIDDADRCTIEFMLDQIHDLSFRAGLLADAMNSTQ